MIETISSLFIIVLLVSLAVFAGYIIISGENEDAKKRKNNLKSKI